MATASTISEATASQPDPGLLEKVKTRDHAAFALLVRRYQPYAYALAMRFVWDREEAEDIVQDAFVRVWENIGSYRSDERFTTWLYAIVTHLGIDRVRTRSRWKRVFTRDVHAWGDAEPAQQPHQEERLDGEQLMAAIRRLVERLPRTQRVVFTLRDLQDLSMGEIGEVTGMSPDAIKANLWHARKKMRQMLGRRSTAERS